ncbi:uncharacterized protein N7477_002533 [Penicillium maclennaniae]|uniref:uncharacterized protein n=1 Tax=Penicillium maclennaniae TaxID=1343394 RepID=UPI00253FA955|nr:uncharacterized protein N7477_002533 [Penicillium maclennaniae]KAJ5676900.1 hypothetical protein N7477_002533 [Penicillium maclennaniae]
MKQYTSVAALAGLVSLVNGHGFVTSPTARMPGAAMKAACGDQVEVNQLSDNYGNIQGELQVASSQSDYNAGECDIWLCKGYKFADNKDNVYSYTAGETIDFTVDIRAPPHRCCQCFFAPNNTDFSVTMPTDLGSQCSTAGACVLQWYWYAESIDQTYESCVDFTVGGSSSGAAEVSSSAAVSSSASAPTSTLVSSAAETSAAVETTAAVQTSTLAVVATTTLATQARASAAPSEQAQSITTSVTATAVASNLSIPTSGTDSEKLGWVESVFNYLVNGN